MKLTKTQTGILFIATGAICFSAKAIFIKLAYKSFPIDSITLLTLRFVFSLPFFVLIAIWRAKQKKFKAIESKDMLWIPLISLLGYYLASWFDFSGLMYISAGLERVILFIYPTLVVIFSRIFYKKTISKKALWALIITYVGIIIIASDPRMFQAKGFVMGVSLVLVSAITYALYLVFGGELIQKYGSINFNTISMICSSIYVIVHFSVFSETHILDLPQQVLGYGLLLAVVSTVIPTFLVAEGIQILGANQSSIIASLGPVSTIFLGYIFLGETLSFQELLGSICVLVGVLLIGK